MNAEVFQKIHPFEYHRQFHKQNARPDGRAFSKYRKLNVNSGSISTADGSVLVRLGGTMIVAGVKAEIAEPRIDSPNNGYLVVNVEQLAMGTPEGRPGPPSDDIQALSSRISEILSGILSLEDLCIVPAKWVWCLYLDVCILNNDGNLFDSCLLSAVAALQNTRLPSIKVDNNTLEFNDSDASKSCLRLDCGVERSPLHLNWTLVPTTFAIFDNPNSPGDAICLVDPTGEEQQLCQGLLHIVVSLAPNSLPQIRSVIKTGGLTVDYALIKDCLKLATEPKRLSDVQTKLAK